MNRMTGMKHKNIPIRSGKRAIMTTVMMAIVSIVMPGTEARADFSLEGYTLTLSPLSSGSSEIVEVSIAGNITNNGYVGVLTVTHDSSNYSFLHGGYWNTVNNTYTWTGHVYSDIYPSRVNSSGIALPGGNSTEFAADINDAGIVVGIKGSHAMMGEWGNYRDYWTDIHPSNQGYGVSRAWRISNNGVIAGVARPDNSSVYIPAMWNTDRDFVPLPAVDGVATGSSGYVMTAVNDAGVIAGNALIDGVYHAFVWDASAEEVILTDLEAIADSALGDDETIRSSTVDGINESGILTGSIYFSDAWGDQRGVMWVPKEGEAGYDLIDVNRWAKEAGLLVEGVGTNEGLTAILAVSDINDHNQIVGTGLLRILSSRWVAEGPDEPEGHYETYYRNQRVAFLLNPGLTQVPEPGATGVVAGVVAMLAYAAMRRRQRGRR
ncbi:MAG: DUF3466 family protein [Opitutaceae bacterium]|jgi:hypothetical protein|nr:DUF3466 family protein [Opitutaceae bacterium]